MHHIATIKRAPLTPSETHRSAAATGMAYRRKPQSSFEHHHHPQPVSPPSPPQDSLAAQAMRASAAHRDASSISSAYSSSAASAAAAARRSHEPSVSTPSPVSHASLLITRPPSSVYVFGGRLLGKQSHLLTRMGRRGNMIPRRDSSRQEMVHHQLSIDNTCNSQRQRHGNPRHLHLRRGPRH
uniref:Uncharacterized protein n=1 Tax=Triticum urartu TaxID=4572 RepID=A0A8R7RD54_TRIUA